MRTEAPAAYIVAARRTALGRVGGLHRARRLEDLAPPVVQAALKDAGLAAGRVGELLFGNTTAGGNPARLIALASGLPETTSALSIDRQCSSGLDAVLIAIRSVAAGDREVVVAGGGDSPSTAPWRIAKPKSLHQLPHFIGLEPGGADCSGEPQSFEASEQLARNLGISRAAQDAYALKSHLRATRARMSRRLVGEIVPLRSNADEARDQSAIEPDLAQLAELTPFLPPRGTLTPGNTSAIHDGAAFAVVVSERVWIGLGRPPAMRLVAQAAQGVAPDDEAMAPITAMQAVLGKLAGLGRSGPDAGAGSTLAAVELGETSAAQAIALAHTLGLDEDVLNADGGAIVRGHPLGAAGAVLVARLFTRLVRCSDGAGGALGAVTLGTIGGFGVAAVFERV